jgi:hypothetical protein
LHVDTAILHGAEIVGSVTRTRSILNQGEKVTNEPKALRWLEMHNSF